MIFLNLETRAELELQLARNIQLERFKADDSSVSSNAEMSPAMVRKVCQINENGQWILKMAMEKQGLSARAYDRILKVARTIADLDGAEYIEIKHLAEAINFRSLNSNGYENNNYNGNQSYNISKVSE